ncbi:primase-like DNA-binding domain-containing protein [Clostridium guangxiense]|uniref:primase-like DNA-binding domain-containing protein n=1 Tax=Clostridium guangxiense TaxID=1662055 RepID=UPI001E59F82B|nr:primase-like DNA-binding domain-containing protein [Clostridium guangxiense]MCD2345769.1 hypothetical protein [Clostridium guangxiense]
MKDLVLIKSQNFNSTLCDFYQNSNKEIFMTREQIGKALQYSEPMKQIAKIHERHKERLDKFSFVKMTNGRNVYFYSMKGVYEIYRWSRQPIADEFIDFVWNVMEEIRKGTFKIEPIQLQLMRETNKTLKFIQSKNAKDSIAKQLLEKMYGIDIPTLNVAQNEADNTVVEFINTQCRCTESVSIKVSILYESYISWCKLNKIKGLSKINFGRNIKLLGIEQELKHIGRIWIGIELLKGRGVS